MVKNNKPSTEEVDLKKEFGISKPMEKALETVSKLPINLQGDVSAAMQFLEMGVKIQHFEKLQALKEKYGKGCNTICKQYLCSSCKAKLEVIEEVLNGK